MPDLTAYKDFGPSFITLCFVGVVLWRIGKALSQKFLGDGTTKGLVDQWYEDERKRWDALCDSVKGQQMLCDQHGRLIGSHAQKMRDAALEACAMCRAIAETEMLKSAPLIAKHCSEIEKILGES